MVGADTSADGPIFQWSRLCGPECIVMSDGSRRDLKPDEVLKVWCLNAHTMQSHVMHSRAMQSHVMHPHAMQSHAMQSHAMYVCCSQH